MDYYDFPLTRTCERPSGLAETSDAEGSRSSRSALDGPKAITFVRNHDIDRGQNFDRGLDAAVAGEFGIGWTEGSEGGSWTEPTSSLPMHSSLVERTVSLRLRRHEHVETQDDRFDDPAIVAGIRFHNLCLLAMAAWRGDPRSGASKPRMPSAFQRGDDRLSLSTKQGRFFRSVIWKPPCNREPTRKCDVVG